MSEENKNDSELAINDESGITSKLKCRKDNSLDFKSFLGKEFAVYISQIFLFFG